MGKDELDFPGFAQEFLRRNPVYRSQFAEVMQTNDEASATIAQEDMARNWGLSFPLPA